MTKISGMVRRAAVVLLAAGTLLAGDTQTWSQSDYGEFDRGIVKNLSLRSDGLITVAPRLREVFDTSLPYLWAVAEDSKGVLYAGGGTSAKLYRIPRGDRGKLLTELDGLAIQAIAIDSQDRVYAATSPDGKVYRVSANGKSELFFDPKEKYIWALTFDSAGNLYVATGDQGEVFRVTPDGKGNVFFKTDETHVRSMAFDGHGNLIVGTDPGGLVLRVSPAGEAFVLYQMPKQEVTAVAVAKDGSIYAAAIGSKPAGAAPQPAPAAPAIQVTTVTVGEPGVTAQASPQSRQGAAPAPPGTAGVAGGSEVYRIDPSSGPEKVWSNAQDVVYAIAFDTTGHALLGTGNHGNVYRIETPFLYTSLLSVAATQITGICGRDGRLFAVTGNVGKVYEIGPVLEPVGTIESDVFDAGIHSLWGRVSFQANLNGGQVAVETRSGNLDQPAKNWSPWSAAITEPKGARTTSPAARFVQWKATLTAGTGDRSPELESVDVAYLQKNVAPQVEDIEVTPANYKFPAPSAVAAILNAAPQTLSLPPFSRRAAAPAVKLKLETAATTNTPALQWAKGYLGARWLAADANGDSLSYKVEIRGVKETAWKPLKDKLTEKYFSFDSTAFPDGEYRLRITASDAPDNAPADALTGELVSAPFLVDNTPPQVSGLAATRQGAKLEVRWHAADALSNITKAEYSLDGGDWTMALPTTQISDSPALDYALAIEAGPGEHTIAVRVEDEFANQSTEKAVVR
jgi:sugar lactone lactonase YvrE